jgi:hypothetical protein
MKVERQDNFKPVVITLETKEELAIMVAAIGALNYSQAADVMWQKIKEYRCNV